MSASFATIARHYRVDLEDVEQEAALVVLEKGAEFDPAKGSREDWIARWVRHRLDVATGRRRVGRRGAVHVELQDLDAPAHEPDPEEVAAARQTWASLAEEERGLVVDLVRVTMREAAQARGLTLTTLHRRVARVRAA